MILHEYRNSLTIKVHERYFTQLPMKVEVTAKLVHRNFNIILAELF